MRIKAVIWSIFEVVLWLAIGTSVGTFLLIGFYSPVKERFYSNRNRYQVEHVSKSLCLNGSAVGRGDPRCLGMESVEKNGEDMPSEQGRGETNLKRGSANRGATKFKKNRARAISPFERGTTSPYDSGEDYRPTDDEELTAAGEVKPFSCSSLTKPGKVTETFDFKPVDNARKVFTFSAYYDDRFDIVRIIAVVDTKFRRKVFCQMWYESKEEPMVAEATLGILPEGHKKRYSAAFLTCKVPDDQVPFAVSVVTNPCGESSNYMKILNTDDGDYDELTGFGVCPGPLHSNYSNIDQLIEHIEVNRVFGAKRFTFYECSVSQEVSRVLSYYKKLGVVDVIPWRVPLERVYPPKVDNNEDIWYFGQLAELNDCLYRNSQRVKYVVPADLDEFLVPHEKKTWSQIIKSLEHPPSILTFLNTFFPTDLKKDAKTPKIDVIVQRLNIISLMNFRRTVAIWPKGQRSKNIVKVRDIVTLGIHNVWEKIPGKLRRVLTPSEGLVHHYRSDVETLNKPGGKGPKGKIKLADDTLVVDESLNRYKQDIIVRVRKVKKDLGLLRSRRNIGN